MAPTQTDMDVTFNQEPEPQPEIVRAILNNLPAIMPYIMKNILPTVREEMHVQGKHLVKEHYDEIDSKRHCSVSLEIDNVRQEGKADNIRITGIPEETDCDTAVSDLLSKMDINIESSKVDTYRIGKPSTNTRDGRVKPRPIIAKLGNRDLKLKVMQSKSKIRPELVDKKIGIFEDLTKARREMLSVVRSKFSSAHTRNANRDLVHVRNPNELYGHGFSLDEVKICEDAFKID